MGHKVQRLRSTVIQLCLILTRLCGRSAEEELGLSENATHS